MRKITIRTHKRYQNKKWKWKIKIKKHKEHNDKSKTIPRRTQDENENLDDHRRSAALLKERPPLQHDPETATRAIHAARIWGPPLQRTPKTATMYYCSAIQSLLFNAKEKTARSALKKRKRQTLWDLRRNPKTATWYKTCGTIEGWQQGAWAIRQWQALKHPNYRSAT